MIVYSYEVYLLLEEGTENETKFASRILRTR